MIPLVEINNTAQKFHVSAETIEKDYIISWILLCLSKSGLKDKFTFYGGTAIKRIYFEDHRFSEDIDLLSVGHFTLNDILEELSCLKYAQDQANLLIEINRSNIITANNRIQLYVNYFGYDEIVGAPKEIRFDFSMRAQLYGKVQSRRIIDSYSDLKEQVTKISVMSLNTILSNKLGLLIDVTRNEPRDLFDIWFLLGRLDQFDFSFKEVCEAFKERLGFKPSLSTLISRLDNTCLRRNWNIRLNKQVAELPNIDLVINDVKIKLRILFSSNA